MFCMVAWHSFCAGSNPEAGNGRPQWQSQHVANGFLSWKLIGKFVFFQLVATWEDKRGVHFSGDTENDKLVIMVAFVSQKPIPQPGPMILSRCCTAKKSLAKLTPNWKKKNKKWKDMERCVFPIGKKHLFCCRLWRLLEVRVPKVLVAKSAGIAFSPRLVQGKAYGAALKTSWCPLVAVFWAKYHFWLGKDWPGTKNAQKRWVGDPAN